MNTELKLSICSYNIFWQIMDLKNSPLLQKIKINELEKYRKNILKNIYLTHNYYNPFIYCFQETSSSYSDIINIFNPKDFDHHVGYSNPEHILTIWNNTAIKLMLNIDGEFEPGRPFSLFVFKNISNKKTFILINIHAGHKLDTYDSIFVPIQNIIKLNQKKLILFDITRIIIVGDFNRNINKEIYENKKKFMLIINNKNIYFNTYKSNNNTCCSLKGYGHTKNFDQVIDTYSKPILVHVLNKESWYNIPSSDHNMILCILKN